MKVKSVTIKNKMSIQSGQMIAEGLCYLTVDVLSQSQRKKNVENTIRTQITTPFSTMQQSDWAEGVRLWNQFGRSLIETIPTRGCPACGEEAGRPIFESYDGYHYHECTHCRCWYVPKQVEADVFDRFFSTNPAALEVALRSFQKRQSEENKQGDLVRFNGYFETVLPLLNSAAPIRYLDIGCGIGNSLVSAKQFDMDACGLETSQECIRLASLANLKVYESPTSLPHQTFDLISFWEALEHISDPIGMLTFCDALLSENGVVAFTVPNLNSPLLRLQRGDSSIVHGGYDTPGHINLFAPNHLEILFDRSGFELIYLDGQYGANIPEFISYFLGQHSAGVSLIGGEAVSGDLSGACLTVLENIGPSVSLFERATLTAPILFGIAVRKSQKTHFEASLAILDRKRRESIIQQATDALPVAIDAMTVDSDFEPESSAFNFLSTVAGRRMSDVQMLTEALAERGRAIDETILEVSRRDEFLVLAQQEIDLRDRLLETHLNTINEAKIEIFQHKEILTSLNDSIKQKDIIIEKYYAQIENLINKNEFFENKTKNYEGRFLYLCASVIYGFIDKSVEFFQKYFKNSSH